MGRYRNAVRWVLVGRRDGLRAWLREQLGVLVWLDRSRGASTPAPAPVPDPTPVAAPEPGWIRVADATELAPGEVLEVLANDRPIAVANVGGTLYAVDGTCPHAGGPLGDGHLDGTVLTCPWHGWSWDVKTGRSLVDENIRVAAVAVKVTDGGVWVAND